MKSESLCLLTLVELWVKGQLRRLSPKYATPKAERQADLVLNFNTRISDKMIKFGTLLDFILFTENVAVRNELTLLPGKE